MLTVQCTEVRVHSSDTGVWIVVTIGVALSLTTVVADDSAGSAADSETDSSMVVKLTNANLR